jgi:hypothetical protein
MPEIEGIKIILQIQSPFADWMIQEDGSVWLLEQTIIRYQNVKVYVNSNEMGSHHRPHVHVDINDKSYQIAIDDVFDVLSPNEDKYARFVIKTYLKSNLNACRKAWNEIQSNYKFVIDTSGNYICP